MRKTIVLIFLSLVLTFASCSDSNQRASPDRVQWKDYFPLAVGNKWTYSRTISAGKQPLFWIVAEVEKPRPVTPRTVQIHRPKGSWVSYNGRAANVKSGEIIYHISGYDSDKNAFKISVLGDSVDWRYDLQEVKDVYWLYNPYGVWEVIRAWHLGEVILVNGFLAFLKPNEGQREQLERARDLRCQMSEDVIKIPAGTFKDCLKGICTQLAGTEPQRITTVQYFAKDVGLIKETQYDSTSQEIYSLKLISFIIK